jgi:hypothetical protein
MSKNKDKETEKRDEAKSLVGASVVVCVCLIFFSIFFGVACGTTDICTGEYFAYSGNFTVFGQTRTGDGVFGGLVATFFISSFLQWISLFFVWPVVGSALYSANERAVARRNPARVLIFAAAYAAVTALFFLFNAMGAVSNVFFWTASAAGTIGGVLVGASVYVYT